MSYTIFDRVCDAVDDYLEQFLDRSDIEAIWEDEIEPILDAFSAAQDELWRAVDKVIAKHADKEEPEA